MILRSKNSSKAVGFGLYYRGGGSIFPQERFSLACTISTQYNNKIFEYEPILQFVLFCTDITNPSPQDTLLTAYPNSQANVRVPKSVGMRTEWVDSRSLPLEKVFFRLADVRKKPTLQSLRSVLNDPDLIKNLIDKFGRLDSDVTHLVRRPILFRNPILLSICSTAYSEQTTSENTSTPLSKLQIMRRHNQIAQDRRRLLSNLFPTNGPSYGSLIYGRGEQ